MAEIYSDKLKHPKWQKKRLEIMKRDKFKCVKCKDEETTLNVHHLIYNNGSDPWEYDNIDLVTVCEHCHFEITMFTDKYKDIDFHKIKILKSNNWENGSRIMFLSYEKTFILSFYDKNSNRITGFNLPYWLVIDIKNFMNKHIKNG